jgi:hypothetical protein
MTAGAIVSFATGTCERRCEWVRTKAGRAYHPLLGERAGVRAGFPSTIIFNQCLHYGPVESNQTRTVTN